MKLCKYLLQSFQTIFTFILQYCKIIRIQRKPYFYSFPNNQFISAIPVNASGPLSEILIAVLLHA